MDEMMATFVEEYRVAPLTKKAYQQTLGMFSRFLNGNKPSEEKVEEFLRHLEKEGASPASVNRHLSAIRAYFLFMKKRAPKELRPDYDLIVRGPKVHRKLPRLLTSKEVNNIVDQAETPFDRALIMTLYDAALRIGELMDLKTEDIDYEGGLLKIIRKGGEETRVPVGDRSLKALREYTRGRHGRVFTQPYWRLNYQIGRLGNRARIRKLTAHQLRHARASDLRRQGVVLEDIKDFLGHAQYQTTLIYARIMPTELKGKLPPAF